MTFPQVETDSIGDYLQQEYGSKPPNTHIGCFYIKLGQEISESPMSSQEEYDIFNDIISPTRWFRTAPGLIFLEEPEATAPKQRVKEADINETIRLKLITMLKRKLHESYNFPNFPIHMMFSRACLYTEKCASSQEITTDKIGEIIKRGYENDVTGNNHIEYFYLFVQAVIDGQRFFEKQINGNYVNVHSDALEELKTLPGDWKSVEPQTTWPGTFFGFKMQEMNEREREKILNGEVRMPLIERLEAKLKITVKVIITRACKYTKSS